MNIEIIKLHSHTLRSLANKKLSRKMFRCVMMVFFISSVGSDNRAVTCSDAAGWMLSRPKPASTSRPWPRPPQDPPAKLPCLLRTAVPSITLRCQQMKALVSQSRKSWNTYSSCYFINLLKAFKKFSLCLTKTLYEAPIT